ncbi:SDR family oxidoreductase [Ignavibacterium sp.]|jgi:NAD(P)-dependent dehydrogenase (short-subunit alcohol dehydrogenase family)|uniref:SDR family oxidoreductase n=1 Tax=Ignavibacterium sp. TaxID=2651167 RepID=UPI0025BA601D|nr:SDR family oxidoreductase [Ignavibacterium sp.]
MKKYLLIFGANGELGKGVTSVLTTKDFEKIYLFDFKFDNDFNGDNVHKVIISDLTVESNVQNAFNEIPVETDAQYFLFSTVGGFWGGKKIWETSIEDLMNMIKMNLITNFNLAKYLSTLVQNSTGGAIIFTSAYTANHPEENKFAYGMSKAALSYLVKTLAIEGESIKLSSMAIAPYILDTKANRKWMNNSNFEKWIKPEEVGELIYDLFKNFRINSGNILELKLRLI